MNKYFNNKNYIMLYLDNFFSNFANSIYSVFTPVILYKSGVEISMIMFIYAIQFLIMGIFSPVCGILTKKFNITLPKFISYILKLISFIIVLNVNKNIINYLLISITYGMSGAINNPLNTFIPGNIVEEEIRGRFNAFKYIIRCFSSIFAYIFTGVLLISNKTNIILIIVFISYLISTILYNNLDKTKFNTNIKKSFSECYTYYFQNKVNNKFKLVSGLRSFIIIERLIAVPVYLYITLGDIQTFTLMYVVSTIVELFSLTIMGIEYDKNSNKTFSVISFIKAFISFNFLIFENSIIVIINQSLYKLLDNVYDSAYASLSQARVEKDRLDTLKLSIVHEMSLCFYEGIILMVLSIVALFNGILSFKVIFLGSIIAIFIINYLTKIWSKRRKI